jgi:hypothetical protein
MENAYNKRVKLELELTLINSKMRSINERDNTIIKYLK